MSAMMLFALAAAFGQSAPAEPSATPEARRALMEFARCVADTSPDAAAKTLAMDFTTKAYRTALRNLSRNNEACFKGRYLEASGLPFAGAVAERLLSKGEGAINVRLARAALQAAPAPRAPTEAASLCVVRSAPDEVGRLLATEVGSEAEEAAIRALQQPFDACTRDKAKLQLTPAAVRSLAATAALHSIRASGQRTAGK